MSLGSEPFWISQKLTGQKRKQRSDDFEINHVNKKQRTNNFEEKFQPKFIDLKLPDINTDIPKFSKIKIPFPV